MNDGGLHGPNLTGRLQCRLQRRRQVQVEFASDDGRPATAHTAFCADTGNV
jgi:hypothetical protein